MRRDATVTSRNFSPAIPADVGAWVRGNVRAGNKRKKRFGTGCRLAFLPKAMPPLVPNQNSAPAVARVRSPGVALVAGNA